MSQIDPHNYEDFNSDVTKYIHVMHVLLRYSQWRIQGGGPNRPRPPLLSDDFNFFGRFFFFFFLLATPEVGLVGGRYPYPIM